MSFILSAQRVIISDLKKNWELYQKYLQALRKRFPPSAFPIATSEWWYSFDCAEAPHDSRLIALKMGDHGSKTFKPERLWIDIELQSAHSGQITLHYPIVYRYSMQTASDSHGIHGDWRYDEFTLTENGHVLHTIEWADGAIWQIEASDLQHRYKPELTNTAQA